MSGVAMVQTEVEAQEQKLTVVEDVEEVGVPWPLYKRLVQFASHTFDCPTVEIEFDGDYLTDCTCGFADLLQALADEGLVDIAEG